MFLKDVLKGVLVTNIAMTCSVETFIRPDIEMSVIKTKGAQQGFISIQRTLRNGERNGHWVRNRTEE